MLTDGLKENLITFIFKKVYGNEPKSPEMVDRVVFQVRLVTDPILKDELCLSVYYGVAFQVLKGLGSYRPSTKKLSPKENFLIPKEFFEALLKQHQKAFTKSKAIQNFCSHRGSNQSLVESLRGDESYELFTRFNSFLLNNFQETLSLRDLIRFIESELDSLDPTEPITETEKEVLIEELKAEEPRLRGIVDQPANEVNKIPATETSSIASEQPSSWEELNHAFEHILMEFVPQMKHVMANDPTFKACVYSEQTLMQVLKGTTPLSQRLADVLERDREYCRNEEGHFVKNERIIIWNLMNSLCNLHSENSPFNRETQEPIWLNELYTLMMMSEKGYNHYYQSFVKEFKKMFDDHLIDATFTAQIQHILCELNRLHLEESFRLI